jgi:polyferredoxin
LRVTANRPDMLRVRLLLAMIFSYLAMMAFVIYSARHPVPVAIASTTFSPAMIALASCMAFSVILTGLFVFMRHGD